LHLGDGVVDGYAVAFVQDLDTEDLAGSGTSLFIGGGQGDVEGKDLVGVPGACFGGWPFPLQDGSGAGFLSSLDFAGAGEPECISTYVRYRPGVTHLWRAAI
jgi:hypothetical protein